MPDERFTLPCFGTRDALRLRGALGWSLGDALTLDARVQSDLAKPGEDLSAVLQLDWNF